MPLFWKPYKSDVTQFIESLKQRDPQLEDRQRQGRSLLWDKALDRQAHPLLLCARGRGDRRVEIVEDARAPGDDRRRTSGAVRGGWQLRQLTRQPADDLLDDGVDLSFVHLSL